jgi:4-diphosphocytidyl-2-C-methyl-D-erythritol kinase
MIVSPGAKLNLGLYITGKRQDGYHDLLTLFYPIPFSDSLEVILSAPSDQHSDGNNKPAPNKWAAKTAPERFLEPPLQPCPDLPVFYSCSGLDIKGDPAGNLCIKAYQLLKADFPELPAVSMHLHKNVPMGAGLGGGSADGAATLKTLNELAGLQLSEEALVNYAARLGSDCPFFIKNTAQIAAGRGEILCEAPAGLESLLKGYTLVLICPGIHVPTATAFKNIIPKQGPGLEIFSRIFSKPPECWPDLLTNDFETTVFAQFEAIKSIKEALYNQGAAYASMTGSGSSVFGLFAKGQTPPAKTLELFKPYSVHSWLL